MPRKREYVGGGGVLWARASYPKNSAKCKNKLCMKRQLVTIKMNLLLKNIYKYTKPYNYLKLFTEHTNIHNLTKLFKKWQAMMDWVG
jgi:hypothetical protein